MSDKVELLPCPFCGMAARLESNHDWHRIVVDHDEACIFLEPEVSMVPATDDQLSIVVADWNRRAALSQQEAPVAVPAKRFVPDLSEQMGRDLARFHETCEDGQEYDVPRDRMRAMARFGLVRWCGGSRFEFTDCGIAAHEAQTAPPAAEQPDTVKAHREALERAREIIEWISCRADVCPKDMRRLEASASELRALLGKETV